MASYVGAVRFPNGDLRYFSYYGTVDIARRNLFASAEEVSHQQDYIPAPRSAADEEPVEVMPYFETGSTKVMFNSRASRSLGLITGPTSLDEAQQAASNNTGGYWG